MTSENPAQLTPREQEMANVFAVQIAQTTLVTRCLIRALAQQPNFDGERFLQLLRQEEQAMDEQADFAKNLIRQIVSEVEGYF